VLLSSKERLPTLFSRAQTVTSPTLSSDPFKNIKNEEVLKNYEFFSGLLDHSLRGDPEGSLMVYNEQTKDKTTLSAYKYYGGVFKTGINYHFKYDLPGGLWMVLYNCNEKDDRNMYAYAHFTEKRGLQGEGDILGTDETDFICNWSASGTKTIGLTFETTIPFDYNIAPEMKNFASYQSIDTTKEYVIYDILNIFNFGHKGVDVKIEVETVKKTGRYPVK
jgi:hypothetical protein